MFRQPSFHPHGNSPQHIVSYPGPPVGIIGGAHFLPPLFPLYEGAHCQSPFRGGLYHGFPLAGPQPSARPPPPPGSPPSEAPPPPPTERNFRRTSKPAPPPPPAMPKDPEMLKNIEVLSSFVVKNGSQFENMARAKQVDDPKFAFLFGGHPGTEAALGLDFYNWKKEHLMWLEERTRASLACPQRILAVNLQGQCGRSGGIGLCHSCPTSPTGSDMDMEDDFSLPVKTSDKNPCAEKLPAFPSEAPGEKSKLSPTAGSSGFHSPAGGLKPEFLTSEPKRMQAPSSAALSESIQLHLGNKLVPLVNTHSARAYPLSLECASTAVEPLAQDFSHHQRNSGLSTQPGSTVLQGFGGNAEAKQAQEVSDIYKAQGEVMSSDLPKGRGTRQQIGFDQLCVEDFNSECNSVPMKKWESHSEYRREALPVLDLDESESSANGVGEGVSSPSDWAPEPSSDLVHGAEYVCDKGADTFEVGKGNDEVGTVTQNKEGGSRSDERQPPDVTAKGRSAHNEINTEKLKPKSEMVQPAVDEFGRLMRQGVSDSDGDDVHHSTCKKQTWTSSKNRSRSRSPGDIIPKRWSLGSSPRRWVRRGRSWSRSPRRNKSHRRTPTLERKWGGDHGSSEKDGRSASRAVGASSQPCKNFVKEKCFRGPCNFFHEEFNGRTHDHWGSWSDGRAKGRAFRHWEPGYVGGRNRSVPTTDDGSTVIDYMRETEFTEEGKTLSGEFSNVELFKQDTGNSESCLVYSPEEPQPVKTSPEVSARGFTPCAAFSTPSRTHLRIASHSGQKTSVFQGHLLPQQQCGLPSTSTPAKVKLDSSVSIQQKSFAVSTPHILQFSPAQVPLPFSTALTCHLSECKPHLPLPTRKDELTSNPDVLSVSTPVPPLKPTFSPLPKTCPQTFISFQQGKGAQYPNNGGHEDTHFRSPGVCAQSHTLWQVPEAQNLPTSQPWKPATQTPVILPQDPPQGPLPRGPTAVYSYSLPLSYPKPPCYTSSLNDVATRPPFAHEQYNPLADSIEPRLSVSGKKESLGSIEQSISQRNPIKCSAIEQWSHLPGNASVPLMTSAAEVVLENISPGLPSHLDGVMAGNVNTRSKSCLVMDNVTLKKVGMTSTTKDLISLDGTQHNELLQKVTSDAKRTGSAEDPKESVPKTKEQKKDKVGHVLHLLRKAMAENVKDLLKPTWKEGQMSKEAFKTIAKKAVDKIMGALQDKGQIPKSQEKLNGFIKSSKPKIAKLVQEYVHKYVKA